MTSRTILFRTTPADFARFTDSLTDQLTAEYHAPTWNREELASFDALYVAHAPEWERRELEDIKAMKEASRITKVLPAVQR